MKKVLAIVLSIVMVLSLITTCLLSSTFAKYVTTGSGTASARVAKWGVIVQTNISGLFLDRYNVNDRNEVISFNGDDIVAPGTSNSFNMNTSVSGVPEVAVEVLTTAKVTISNWSVNGYYYCPLIFTINGATKSGNEFENHEEFEAWIEGRIAKSSAKYPPLTDLSAAKEIELSISWEWPFEVDDDNDPKNGIANDVLDTGLGNKAADGDKDNDPKIEFSITQTVAQIDSYEFIIERDEDKIKFGSYPQTQVTDAALSATLTQKAGALPSAENAQDWTSYGYYIDGQQSNYMWYTDIVEDGEKYRGVYFTQYRPFYTVHWSSGAESSYQDDYGYSLNNVYWFKYEPISWTVLDENEAQGTLLVFCDMILDAQQFDGVGRSYKNNYVESTVRRWLNETFYNTAFTELQKELIFNTTVDNSAESTGHSSNPYASGYTNDNVFLLSVKDVENADYGFVSDVSRQKVATAYAKAQGCEPDATRATENAWWWLRSPATASSSSAHNVSYHGSITYDNTCGAFYGIVPAIQLRLYGFEHNCHDTDQNHYCDECDTELSNHRYEAGECTICLHKLYVRDQNRIMFGSYPQTDITSSAVASTLSTRIGNPTTNPSAWTSYGYYIDGQQSNYMWYTDIVEDGEKYRGVYFTDYRPFHTAIASSAENSYQDDNGYTVNNVYWFKYEPLFWTVLNENTTDGTALILCDMIIDSQKYYITSETRIIGEKTVYANNYAQSTVRKWLNENFYDIAFNELQKQIIEYTLVENSSETTGIQNNQYVCEDVEDKVFLFSLNDAVNSNYGFLDNFWEIDVKRQKKNTDYSKIQGAYVSSIDNYQDNGYWWLRSPNYYYYNYARYVSRDGYMDYSAYVNRTDGGVVPALRICLE